MLSFWPIIHILRCVHEIFTFLRSSLVFKIQCAFHTHNTFQFGPAIFQAPQSHIRWGQWLIEGLQELSGVTPDFITLFPDFYHQRQKHLPLAFPRRPLAMLKLSREQLALGLPGESREEWASQENRRRSPSSTSTSFPTWLHPGKGKGLHSCSLGPYWGIHPTKDHNLWGFSLQVNCC